MTLSWDGLRGEAFTRLEASTKGRGTLLHCTGSAPQSLSSREIIMNSPSQDTRGPLGRSAEARPESSALRGVEVHLLFKQTFDAFGLT